MIQCVREIPWRRPRGEPEASAAEPHGTPCNEKLLTKTYRAKWSQQQDILCPMCESAEETTEHLFVHCPVALRLWALLHDAIDFDLQTLSLQGLWEASKKLKPTGDRSPGGKVSQSLVPVVLWALWLARNSRAFRNTRVYHENIWETAVFFIKAWGRACIGMKIFLVKGKFEISDG
ncbi:hypothetical protein QJS10_CPA05g02282 [Acorus calamus]|uniref:Reverse transcriptase zinc-binding domain-containing protein n=1 Tax=Acorus calamus TaxID=4465 RepID=A0AAV9EVS0_ACOCL|nr:hypothetical protein QJS10_CPA05g02282 [Acorus calamus]